MINYYLLTKPGILFGNLLTFTAGFLLASRGAFNVSLFFSTLVGLTAVMASACIFNNYIDRELDKKMKRTRSRPLANGDIPQKNAVVLALLLVCAGSLILLTCTNLLATLVTLFGFFVYVVLYSLWKCRTLYGTAIGSLSGAVPPVVGYCAVTNHFDAGAFILFSMLVLWQMPHFFAITLIHLDDYTKAEIPVLPVKKGVLRTKIHMFFYILGFIAVTSLLTFYGYAGYFYLVLTLAFSLIWLGVSFMGLINDNYPKWSRYMFQLSLVVIVIVCFSIPLEFYLETLKKAKETPLWISSF